MSWSEEGGERQQQQKKKKNLFCSTKPELFTIRTFTGKICMDPCPRIS